MAASGAHVEWVVPPKVLEKKIEEYGRKVITAVLAVAEYIATEAQNDMRNNAPWTDRTGNARSALFSFAEEVGGDVVHLYLSHGSAINYGVFLEKKYGGRYAIIIPTMQRIMPRLKKMLRDLLA